jgi:hypothetical protein
MPVAFGEKERQDSHMDALLDVFVWIAFGLASLSILAILWSWASDRLNETVPQRYRDGPSRPPRYDPGT